MKGASIQRAVLVAILALSGATVGAAQHRTRAGEAPRAAPARRLVLEGLVLEPDGAPAEGAVVVSSAGGRARCDGQGAYRLEIDLPRSAERLQVTAIGRGTGLAASTSVPAAPAQALVMPEPLVLSALACSPDWLPTFGAPAGTNGEVEALAVFDDGSGPALYAGGAFTVAAGVPASALVRWDGTNWSEVGGGLDGANPLVHALASFDDGSGPGLYVGGRFPSADGVPASAVARWDGTSWSALGSEWSEVRALAVFDDGGGPALYASGEFASGLPPAEFVARWDGAAWQTLGSSASALIDVLCVFDDGAGPALFAGGEFTSLDGVPTDRIARWDGSSWSSLGAGLDAPVRSLAVLEDVSGATLVVGGEFTLAGGEPASRVARWDGTSWSALGGGTSDTVDALLVVAVPANPVLYATGEFRFADGLVVNRIARWDGQAWSGLGNGLDDFGRALAVFDDGNGPSLHVGGRFQRAWSVPASRLARWDGTSWSALGCGLRWVGGRVSALATFDSGSGPELVAGGFLTAAGGGKANRIARWDGLGWSSLGQGVEILGTSGIPTVEDLAVFDDESGPALYACGFFTHAGGVPAPNVARWDGATWSPLGSGLSNLVWALAVFDDGSGPALYAGGHFTTAGGIAANRVARWDGMSWSPLGAGVNSSVTSLGVFDDGSGPALYVGGSFTSAGGAPASRIARWDGASWAPLASGLDDSAWAFQAFDDGSGNALYVGGLFTSAGGVPASRIARWDGTSWSALASGVNADVYGLAVLDDGSGPALFAGGLFTVAGDLAANRVARWDGGGWSALGSGTSNFLDCLAVHDLGSGPALFAGGAFESSQAGDAYLARWGCTPSGDTLPPTIVAPSGRTVADRIGSAPGEIVTFVVRACDETDPSPALECSPPSGSLFPRGTTLVTCTATDSSGNVAIRTFPVTVEAKARRP